MKDGKQRVYAFLLLLGASILLFRTIKLAFFENGLETLIFIVASTIFIEMISDVVCLCYSIRWFAKSDSAYSSVPLRAGALSTIIHLIRVIIFVLGRTPFLMNFDIKPEYQSSSTMDPFWVFFALILSILGLIGVGCIYWMIKKHRKKAT